MLYPNTSICTAQIDLPKVSKSYCEVFRSLFSRWALLMLFRILTDAMRLEKINTWRSIVLEETNMFLFVDSLNECWKI